ncbi:MAG: flagellar assembly peptidoglycan hydrolase FlgJ [Gammaproteobacteria bacterium]
MTVSANPNVYTDLQGLTQLRGQAQQKSPEAMREAARQFEALFVQMMLKSMRDAKIGEGLMDSEQSDMYRDMYDKQMSMEMTRQRGFGLAAMIVKQLDGNAAPAASVSAAMPGLPALPAQLNDRAQSATVAAPRVSTFAEGLPAFAPACSARARAATPVDLSTPQAFVQSVWPHAQQAARDLGVRPEVLVAQAALETGWGRAMMQQADGSSSHNLFGIKASTGWVGAQVSVPTLEYADGIAVRTRASFRAYGSFADSFNDYVDFLKSNPRYREALAQADNPAAFANALQRAGYATDPAYAQKITAIVNGDTLQTALTPLRQSAELAQLKQADGLPLS